MERLPFSLPVFVVTAMLALPAAEGGAAERRLSAPEIADALTGHTVDGLWGGTAYRSYFDATGLTIYQPRGRQPERGRWRVDAAKDQYCSWWERSGWSCYEVNREGDTIIWVVPGDDRRYPSTLLEGRRL